MLWTRHGHGWYAGLAHNTVPGDSVAVEAPLHRLRGLRVASFLAPGDTLAAPADSARTIALRMAADRPVTLRFVRSDHAWRVHDVTGGRDMMVADDLSDLFAHTTNELRDRRLLQFDPTVAERISFVSPAMSGELVRAGGRWAFPNPAMGRVNPDHAADFVRALRALKWSQPGGEAARTGGHALYRIEIRGAHDRIIDELTGGPYDESTRWVASQSSHGAWLIDRARLDELSGRFARIKAR
jgi:hypothetical protein